MRLYKKTVCGRLDQRQSSRAQRRKYPSLIMSLLLLASPMVFARSSADYLPADADPDPAIPTPESVQGWEVGDWHVSHDRLIQYMVRLAESSPRVSIREIGRTWEQRPLLQLVITSEQNQSQLESLRQSHLQAASNPGGENAGPLVIWLGYSVHGNEPSGSNASQLVAYYLAASRSAFVQELLQESVILLDPSFNPDGLNRFASWVNSNAGKIPVADPVTRQHAEPWPYGRTNHYLFDLNRDWLPAVHPESRARLGEFQRWQPHVLTDHHEQGSYDGLFFQPGVPSRQNPLIPARNLELTRALAEFHAEALNLSGQPYFAEDSYDDFYFGKGSTYPDINGGVGILFEQRAIRGQALETGNGIETFVDAVSNQLAMSLSTLRGAWTIRDELKRYRNEFRQSTDERAARAGFNGWIIGDDGDAQRARALLDLFDLHDIDYRRLGEPVRAGEYEFAAGQAWVLPARQRQFALLEAMMEQRTQFADDTFYDVSAWTLPLAYNLPFAKVDRLPRTDDMVQASTALKPSENAVAWVVSWNQLQAPAVLQQLLSIGARVRTALKPFSLQSPDGLQEYPRGSLVVLRKIQPESESAAIYEVLRDAALAGLQVGTTQSNLTALGPDFGSGHFARVEPIKPLIIGGLGVSAYDAGEIWHLLDHRLGMPAPMVNMRMLESVRLSDYTHLLLASGDFSNISDRVRINIQRWVLEGGILLASATAATWAEALCFEADPVACVEPLEQGESAVTADPIDDASGMAPETRSYAEFVDDEARQTVGGAIVAGRVDQTHPLGFGFARPDVPLFRRGTTLLAPAINSYSNPVSYLENPLLAGFMGESRQQEISGAVAVTAERRERGLVVRFANNPLFRGFWRGTERLYINALYFGQVVTTTELPE